MLRSLADGTERIKRSFYHRDKMKHKGRREEWIGSLKA